MTREERKKAITELKALDTKLEKLDQRINPLRDRLSRLEDTRTDLVIDIGILVADLWPPKKKPKRSLTLGALVDPYDYRDYPTALLPTDEPLS